MPNPLQSLVLTPCKNLLRKLMYVTRLDIPYYYGRQYATTSKRNKPYASEYARVLCEEFEPDSVIDIGCGTADFLAEFAKRGLDIQGVDVSKANEAHLHIDTKYFIRHDLRDPFRPNKKYGLCTCVEVAEHIEEKFAKTLATTITDSSDAVFFTAATPGQGGVGHVNEKPHSWWIDLFGELGFEFQSDRTVRLKEKLEQIEGIHRYYVNNIMVFCRKCPS